MEENISFRLQYFPTRSWGSFSEIWSYILVFCNSKMCTTKLNKILQNFLILMQWILVRNRQDGNWRTQIWVISLACISSKTHCARHSLRRPWKLVLRIVAWSKPLMFCEESLGNIKFRAFPKRVGPQILLLESVDYFGTSEHYWVVEKK